MIYEFFLLFTVIPIGIYQSIDEKKKTNVWKIFTAMTSKKWWLMNLLKNNMLKNDVLKWFVA